MVGSTYQDIQMVDANFDLDLNPHKKYVQFTSPISTLNHPNLNDLMEMTFHYNESIVEAMTST
jgi:hypothetical protein